jgi:hypothetical protein
MKEFKINSLAELSRAITEIDAEWHDAKNG